MPGPSSLCPGSIPICLARTPTSRCPVQHPWSLPDIAAWLPMLGDKQTKDTRPRKSPSPTPPSSANDADPAPQTQNFWASSLASHPPQIVLLASICSPSSAPLYLFVPHHLAKGPFSPRTLQPLNLLRTWSSRSLAPMCGQMGLLHCKPDPVTYLTAACRLGEGSDLFTWCPRLLTPEMPTHLFSPASPWLPTHIYLQVKRRVLQVHDMLACACKDLLLFLQP